MQITTSKFYSIHWRCNQQNCWLVSGDNRHIHWEIQERREPKFQSSPPQQLRMHQNNTPFPVLDLINVRAAPTQPPVLFPRHTELPNLQSQETFIDLIRVFQVVQYVGNNSGWAEHQMLRAAWTKHSEKCGTLHDWAPDLYHRYFISFILFHSCLD